MRKKVFNIVKKNFLNIYFELKNMIKEKENHGDYIDLAPKSDLMEKSEYFKALSWALQNDKITNIAITGAYGSGKSSVLKTFEKENKKYNYLNISLALFEETEREKLTRENEKGSNDDEIVESILQQIFYQEKGNKIPKSRFRKIKNIAYSLSVLVIFSIFLPVMDDEKLVCDIKTRNYYFEGVVLSKTSNVTIMKGS